MVQPPQPKSPRPLAQGALGGKHSECFAYSAAYDSDEEFLRRYAGTPDRVKFMLEFHADDDTTAIARERLALLTK